MNESGQTANSTSHPVNAHTINNHLMSMVVLTKLIEEGIDQFNDQTNALSLICEMRENAFRLADLTGDLRTGH